MPYPDGHTSNRAFLANRLDRLADQIATQGEDFLREAGLHMPSRSVSLMLVIGEHGPLSAADAASLLDHPHQLVTQRMELLIGLGLVEREGDPADGRRKILMLSAAGEEQYARLLARLSQAADVFAALSREIGVDLWDLIDKTSSALEQASLLDRLTHNPSIDGKMQPTRRRVRS